MYNNLFLLLFNVSPNKYDIETNKNVGSLKNPTYVNKKRLFDERWNFSMNVFALVNLFARRK